MTVLSPVLVPAFTVIFAITGVRALARLFTPAGGDRTVELAHLLMSIAMVGMVWGWPAGPGTAAGAAQLVVFGVLAVVFVARVLDPAASPPAGNALHLLGLAAMLWMVLSMPAAHGPGAHPAAAVTQLVTIAFAVALCAAPFARALTPSRSVAQVLMSGGTAAMLLAML